MEELDFGPLKETLDKIAIYLVGILLACTFSFLFIYFLARLIRIPKKIAWYLGVITILAVAYFAFTSGLIPDRL